MFIPRNSYEYYADCPRVRTCIERRQSKVVCNLFEFYIKIFPKHKENEKDFREALKNFDLAIQIICSEFDEKLKNDINKFLNEPLPGAGTTRLGIETLKSVENSITLITKQIFKTISKDDIKTPKYKNLLAFTISLDIYFRRNCVKTYKEISEFILRTLNEEDLEKFISARQSTEETFSKFYGRFLIKFTEYCQTCSNGYYFNGMICKEGKCPLYYNPTNTSCSEYCTPNYYTDTINKRCIQNCPTNLPYVHIDNINRHFCVEKCPPNSYKYGNKCYFHCDQTKNYDNKETILDSNNKNCIDIPKQ